MNTARRFSGYFVAFVLACAVCGASDTKNEPRTNPTSAANPAPLVVEASTSSVVIVRDGKRYVVDLDSRSVHELEVQETSQQSSSSSSTASPQQEQQQPDVKVTHYTAGDERLISVPTGKRLQRRGLLVTFTHRFPYSPTFRGISRGHTLGGLDDFGIASFGFKYGITNRLSVSAFRSPSVITRPIELMAAYQIAEEREGAPLNASVRFSVQGQNDFSRNFTTSFEALVSRSITHRAAVYLAPTLSIHNRPLLGGGLAAPPYQPCGQATANGAPATLNVRPCADTFSLGIGAAFDIRPTVAILAEVIPTLVNGRDLGIHRPPFGFGIQKKIFRHVFTLGFTTGPGVTVAQRIGTRATFRNNPAADKPSGLSIGFNLSRQLR